MAALDGMRVLDMTQYEAGTSCTQMLAWLGADVVKIEPPQGDPGRRTFGRTGADSQYFLNYNSNKRSVVLDLAKPEGRDLLLHLVPRFNVFVENFGPGVIEKLDIGYEVMRRINPRMIYARIKGYGLSGPYASYRCFDPLAQAAAGTFSVTGEPDGPPVQPGPTLADSGTGVQAALAITAAYVQLLNNGYGQQIELSMQEATLTFMRTRPLAAWASDQPMQRRGSLRGAPSGMYPCAPGGPNDYIYLTLTTSRMWDTLCVAIDKPYLANDPRFATPEARSRNAETLREEITQWTSTRDKHEAMRHLCEAGVPASAIFDSAEVFRDPHLKARGFIHKLQHPEAGEVTLFGPPFRLSESRTPLARAPLLGEHSREVLRDELGLSEEELALLQERGVIGARLATAGA